MADPTALVSAHKTYLVDRQRHAYKIKNAEALVVYALAALNRSLGKVEFMDDAADLIPLGLVLGAADGDNTNHLTGDSGGTYSADVRGGIILANVAVTGVSAITDVGKLVYATDGQTMTLTRPSVGLPLGFVTRWYSSTSCDVYLFDLVDSEKLMFSPHPSGRRIKNFGTFPTNALQGTAAVTLWTETSYEHYKIISLHAQSVAHDNAALAGSQVLNIDIAGVDTTGGLLTVAYTNCDAAGDMGTPIDAATAITAANEVHIGDTVKLEMAASGTGFTADVAAAFMVYAVIEPLPGA